MEQSTSAATDGTVGKALDVLFHLHEAPAGRGVSAIGRALGLPKSTTHRLLAVLERRGLVERDETGGYVPGIGLVALGLGVLDREPLVVAGRPVLAREAALLGQTLFLVAARAGHLSVLDVEQGSGFLRAAPRTGERIPVHATAIGKLFLAFDPQQVELGDEPQAFTPRTRAGRALARDVARARARGWADQREEWIPGLAGVAAPVFVRGRLMAAVAAAGPTSRLHPADTQRFADHVKRAANQIAQRLESGRTRGEAA